MANHGGVPVRPATATAVAPTLAEGQLAILSTDLTGALRTTSSGGAGGGTSALDEAAFVEGTTPGTPEMGVYNDSLAAVTTGKVAVTRIAKFRSMLATLWSGSANNEVGTLANPVRTDTTGTTPQPVSGTVTTQQSGAGTVLSGQQAVTAAAVVLPSNASRSVTVKALLNNAINVYLGPAGITTATGLELAPGDAVTLQISNTNLLFVIASTTGASIAWLAVN